MARTPGRTGQGHRNSQASGNGESIMGYFRKILLENPKLLKTRSNEKLLQRWLDDHPGEKEVPNRVKQGLSNIKSHLRKHRRRRGRKPQTENAEAAAPAPGQALWETSHPAAKDLEVLEVQIDDCITLAKNIDREQLENIITLLRRARNQVVWKSGQ